MLPMSNLSQPVTVPFAASAPGRVNLIGEHTDYNDGFVLPMAIERHVTIHVRPRGDRLAVLRTQRDRRPVTLDLTATFAPVRRSWSNYVRGVIEGYRRIGFVIPGFDADISATLPAGAGLSSSAALEVAMATVVETLCGQSLTRLEKALLCQQAEHEFAGVPCGIMDQFAVCCGEAGHALQLDCRSREVVAVPIDAAVRVLVFDSGVKHSLADGEYANRRAECASAAGWLGVGSLRDVTAADLGAAAGRLPTTELARARHVVGEIARVPAFVGALTAGDWDRAGRLMGESHRSLSVDYGVSCPELDRIVELSAGVPGIIGCRMTGGGFGGCAVALVEADGAEATGRRLHAAYRDATGIDAAWFLTAAAGGPAVVVG